MARQLLYYHEVLPLIPDSFWYTSKELYEVLYPRYPHMKIGSLRVSLRLWEKKGLLVSKPLVEENRYLYIRGTKLYRKATNRYRGFLLGSPTALSGQRKCLGCRELFMPDGKYNWLCGVCVMMDH